MVIFNWIDVLDEELTQEYKSGNAREVKVTHLDYHLCFLELLNSVYLLGWRHLVRNAGPDVHVAGFAQDDQEKSELEKRRRNRARLP